MSNKIRQRFENYKRIQKRNLKGLEFKEDPRDWLYTCAVGIDKISPETQEILDKPNWRIPNHIKEVYDQGRTPMCMAYTTRRIKEVQEINDRGAKWPLSEGFIYLNRVSSDYMYFLNTSGMICREALAHVCKEGVCRREDFNFHGDWANLSYDVRLAIRQRTWTGFPEGVWERAEENKALSYAKLLGFDDAKLALAVEQCGLAIHIPITSKFKAGFNEKIDLEWAKENNRGGHAVTQIGWKTTSDGKRWRECINSWGTAWAPEGLFYLEEGYPIVEEYSLVDEETHPQYWRVQVGAFTVKKNAEDVQIKLTELGYPTYMVTQTTEGILYYKVQIGAFHYKKNADALEKKLLNDPNFQALKIGTWVRKY